jgi:hypothetical protein
MAEGMMADTAAKMARRVQAISETIGPMLHGLGPDIQGAVLADLLAIWLAGFQGPDAEAVRDELLDAHVHLVRKLIPVNEKIALDRLAGGTRQ